MEKRIASNEYDNSIQGLRGLAIILIIVSHMFGRFNSLGGFGTAIFVAISGYMACKKCRENDSNPGVRQIVYRIAKLYPLYLIVTCITAIYFNPEIVYGTSRAESIAAFICNILMIQSYIPKSSFFGAFSQVGWYMPFVALSLICLKPICKLWRKMDSGMSYIAVLVFAIIQFLVIASGWKNTNWLIYFSPFCRLFEFVIGGCIFIIADESGKGEKNDKARQCMLMIIIAAVLIITSLGLGNYFEKNIYARIALWYIPTWSILICDYKFSVIRRVLESTVLVFVGNISFELFLLHLTVIKAVETIFGVLNISETGIKPVSVLLMLVTAYLINKLDNMWKKKAYTLICRDT